MSEPPRGCQNPCISAAEIFTPNGDGINDYWIFNQAFVSSYSLSVINRWNNTIYTKSNTPIYENGTVFGWDGTGVSSSDTYWVLLTYKDCAGITRNTSYPVYVSGLKSLDISGLQDNLTNNELNIEEDKTFNIKAYPNPTSGKVSIEANNCDLIFDYFLSDMTGKILTQVFNVSGSDEIDLSSYPSGMYLLQIKTEENIQLCKLIKK